MLLTIWLLAHTDQISGMLLVIYLVALGLYALSIYCGRLLLTDKYLNGIRLSIVNQTLQVLGITMFGYGFVYISGIKLTGELTTILDSVGFKMGLHFGHSGKGIALGLNFFPISLWKIDLNTDDKPFELSLNFVAIYLIYFTNKLRKTVKKEQISHEEEQLADLAITGPLN